MPIKYDSQKGAVLITALFIMTLVAIAATSMSLRLQIDIYRTNLVLNADKLYLATQASTFWAMSELKKGLAIKLPKKSMKQRWRLPISFPEQQYSYPNTRIKAELIDLQARYNLNNLVDKKAVPGFIQLLKKIVPKMNNAKALTLALAINQWLSRPKEGKVPGNSYYLKQKPPYQMPYLLMSSISELKLIKGMTKEVYNALFPYVCVLPEKTAININTAEPPVLYTLGIDLKEQQVNKFVAERGEKGFTSREELNKLLNEMNIDDKNITINSDYFQVISKATKNAQSLISYVTLNARLSKKGKPNIIIISESLNIP